MQTDVHQQITSILPSFRSITHDKCTTVYITNLLKPTLPKPTNYSTTTLVTLHYNYSVLLLTMASAMPVSSICGQDIPACMQVSC